MYDLIPFDPFKELLETRSLFDRLFGRSPSGKRGVFDFDHFHPAIELFEEKGNLVVKAELAGIDKKDIDVTLNEKTLTIKKHIVYICGLFLQIKKQ